MHLRLTRVLGFFMMVASPVAMVFYAAWVTGLIGLDPELAIRLAVSVFVIAALGVMGLLGYVMVTSPRPAVIKPRRVEEDG